MEAADDRPRLRLDALCRLARGRFEAAAASICLQGRSGAWIDHAAGAAAHDWRFATSLDDRPDAGRQRLVIEDMRREPAWSGLPFVMSAPGLRFLASVPIGDDGRLAIFDTRPRKLAPGALGALDDLAQVAGDSLALYRQAIVAAEREDSFRLLAEMSTDTIVRGNLDGVRLYISPAVKELLGYEPAELIGRRAIEITHPDDAETFRAMMQQLREGRLERARSEQRQRHKDGSWVWLEAFIRLTRDRLTGQPDGYVTSVRGIDRRKDIEARLAHIANHDELTGLPNRKLFRDRLLHEARLARGGDRRFALLWMDIDRFKQVNDAFGHPAGDAVLRQAAERFRATVGRDDLVARLGGDEFVVIRPIGAGAAEAEQLAARLIAALAAPFAFDGREVVVGLSIGIVCAPEGGSDPDELLAAADHALYDAKSAGRNTYRLFAAPPPG